MKRPFQVALPISLVFVEAKILLFVLDMWPKRHVLETFYLCFVREMKVYFLFSISLLSGGIVVLK